MDQSRDWVQRNLETAEVFVRRCNETKAHERVLVVGELYKVCCEELDAWCIRTARFARRLDSKPDTPPEERKEDE
jgi:hypothetical protein